MFLAGMKESRTEKLELKNISSSVFSSLLHFIYTGQVFLTQTTVQEVLVAADMLGLPEVIDSCTEFLKSELHPSNAIGIYRLEESELTTENEAISSKLLCGAAK